MQVTNDLAQHAERPCPASAPLQEDLGGPHEGVDGAVATSDPDGVLVIAVDAADNAAVAAVERKEAPASSTACWRVPSPQKVCVVVFAARSHRVAMTGAADGPPSTSHRSTLYLDATPAPVPRRHLAGGRCGVPRADRGQPAVQFYVLEQANRSGWKLPRLLEASSKTP